MIDDEFIESQAQRITDHIEQHYGSPVPQNLITEIRRILKQVASNESRPGSPQKRNKC
jgi:hypothetical protein